MTWHRPYGMMTRGLGAHGTEPKPNPNLATTAFAHNRPTNTKRKLMYSPMYGTVQELRSTLSHIKWRIQGEIKRMSILNTNMDIRKKKQEKTKNKQTEWLLRN